MRVAVLSNIHGNIWALEAVLKDIRNRGVDGILNLGDCLYGPLAPRETAEMLRAIRIEGVCGDLDRALLSPARKGERGLMTGFILSLLDETSLAWLAGLPAWKAGESETFFCHGDPGTGAAGFSIRAEAPASPRRPERNGRRLIFRGHGRAFRTSVLADGTTIVCPGSVGLPAHRSDRMLGRFLSAGTPHARYALLSTRGRRRDIQSVAVPYPWETAAAAALDFGRPDWAVWLRSGRA